MEEVRLIEVKQDIQADNVKAADELRKRLSGQKTFLLNLMSSPGAGKTTTILKTIETLRGDLEVGVLEADIDSVVDAEKMAAAGIATVQLRTGGFCHLDATMVISGLDGMISAEKEMGVTGHAPALRGKLSDEGEEYDEELGVPGYASSPPKNLKAGVNTHVKI